MEENRRLTVAAKSRSSQQNKKGPGLKREYRGLSKTFLTFCRNESLRDRRVIEPHENAVALVMMTDLRDLLGSPAVVVRNEKRPSYSEHTSTSASHRFPGHRFFSFLKISRVFWRHCPAGDLLLRKRNPVALRVFLVELKISYFPF